MEREQHTTSSMFSLTKQPPKMNGNPSEQVCRVSDEDPAAAFFFLLLPVGVPVDTHRKVSLFLNSLLIFDMSFGCWIFYSHSLLKKETITQPTAFKVIERPHLRGHEAECHEKERAQLLCQCNFPVTGDGSHCYGCWKSPRCKPKGSVNTLIYQINK